MLYKTARKIPTIQIPLYIRILCFIGKDARVFRE